jgi:DNA-binding MarR family transcriptional regulator
MAKTLTRIKPASVKPNAETANSKDDRFEYRVHAFDLDSAFGFLFRRLNSLATALFAQTTGQTEITPMQMGVLLTVQQAGLISLRELARKMCVDRSTLQEVVKRMVEKGLLSRRSPANDKRAHELWLAADGIELVRTHFAGIEELQGRLLEGVPPEEAQITQKCLKFILDHHGY